MTDLERLFHHLVRTLKAIDPARLRQPIAIANIRGAIIPYRHHRRALRIESSEDYELALIRLCAGEGGFASLIPDEARARFEEEAVSPNPELGIVRQFSDASVMLAPARIAEAMAKAEPEDEATSIAPAPAETSGAARAPETSAAETPIIEAAATETPIRETPTREIPEADALVDALFATSDAAPDTPATPREAEQIKPARAIYCVACAEMLPVDRPAKFCPYCGKSQTPRQCAACGADLEPGWRFCALCGHGT